jgi:hypothetical protein
MSMQDAPIHGIYRKVTFGFKLAIQAIRNRQTLWRPGRRRKRRFSAEASSMVLTHPGTRVTA